MGSKFSKYGGVQKPPPVCKKPPPPDPIPPPYWQDVQLVGFIDWYNQVISGGIHITAPLDMYPVPGGASHLGETIIPPWTITLEMTPHGDPVLLDFEAIFFIGGSPAENITITNQVPNSLDPFDSGLITLKYTPPSDMIYCRVWW